VKPTESFTTSYVINKDTYQELQKHMRSPGEKMGVVIVSLIFFALAVLGFVVRNSAIATFGLTVGVLVIVFFSGPHTQTIKTSLERARELGTTEAVWETSFADEEIKMHLPDTGGTFGTSYLNYSAVVRFAQTENMYALFTKANHIVIVNKTSLDQEQKGEDFLRFIEDKCKYVRF